MQRGLAVNDQPFAQDLGCEDAGPYEPDYQRPAHGPEEQAVVAEDEECEDEGPDEECADRDYEHSSLVSWESYFAFDRRKRLFCVITDGLWRAICLPWLRGDPNWGLTWGERGSDLAKLVRESQLTSYILTSIERLLEIVVSSSLVVSVSNSLSGNGNVKCSGFFVRRLSLR